ncbi:MAG: hypothetical protein KF729_12375 [Sandaracinaceae bacterium]|nr:hypothetical protein [Sandaracinaceae bacterium]
MTVYINADLDLVMDALHTLQAPGSAAISIVEHERSRRGAASAQDFGATGYGTTVLSPIPDVVDGERYAAHKLGGAPYFLHGEPYLEHEVTRLIDRDDYFHLLQVALPAYREDADVAYDWPFGSGLMHVLVRGTGSRFDWRAFWE